MMTGVVSYRGLYVVVVLHSQNEFNATCRMWRLYSTSVVGCLADWRQQPMLRGSIKKNYARKNPGFSVVICLAKNISSISLFIIPYDGEPVVY